MKLFEKKGGKIDTNLVAFKIIDRNSKTGIFYRMKVYVIVSKNQNKSYWQR